MGVQSGRSSAEPSERKPNFIIVLTEDMSYGDSGCYNGRVKTPRVETLGAAGMKFTDFHSSGAVCSPTRAGLITGRYEQRTGLPGVICAAAKLAAHYTGLQTSEVTFPRLLKEVG